MLCAPSYSRKHEGITTDWNHSTFFFDQTFRMTVHSEALVHMVIRPRRSVLYMPGSNARAIEKARSLPVDAIILDLEDSVAPEAKLTARGQVVDAVRAGGFGPREVIVRINALDTE